MNQAALVQAQEGLHILRMRSGMISVQMAFWFSVMTTEQKGLRVSFVLHVGGQAVAGRKHQEKKRIGQRVGSLSECNFTGQPGLHTAPTWASCLLLCWIALLLCCRCCCRCCSHAIP